MSWDGGPFYGRIVSLLVLPINLVWMAGLLFWYGVVRNEIIEVRLPS